MFPFLHYLNYIRWHSVLDILLVAFLFYQCILWVRESRAVMAATGLAVIGGVAVLAHWSGLILAGWLFQSLWSVIWLIIVIVFQAELRQILERSSLVDLLRGRREVLRRETASEIIDAVFDLAHDKIGGLIVLPQHDPLTPHLQGGIRVDALVSREVLRSLLQPPVPTHDGAIVLRANRIERAGSFLPMSTTRGLPASYGARHRAALGLTERCDAVCLLVSEEQGTVALAQKGQLRPCTHPIRLRQELARVLPQMQEGAASPRWRWQWVTQQLGAKALAIGVATGLWIAVVGQQSAEIALTIPVEYQHLASAIELRGEVPSEATVRLRGPQLALDALRSNPVRARISLARVRDGLNFVALNAQQIALPPGVEITDIRPAFLTVEVRTKDLTSTSEQK